jgi:hypothetical protein
MADPSIYFVILHPLRTLTEFSPAAQTFLPKNKTYVCNILGTTAFSYQVTISLRNLQEKTILMRININTVTLKIGIGKQGVSEFGKQGVDDSCCFAK